MLDLVRFMFHMEPTRSILIGLAVLHRKFVGATADPYPKAGELRAILALLHALSDGERHPFDGFWKAATSPRLPIENETTCLVIRRNDMLAHWHGILRAFGWEASIPLMEAIHRAEAPDRPPVPPAQQERL